MAKVLLGIMLGSAAASAAFLFLDRRESENLPETVGVSVQSVGGGTSEVSDSPASIDVVAPSLGNSSGIEAIGTRARNPEEREAELIQLIEDAQAELNEVAKSRILAELGPIVSPLPLPPEFDRLGDVWFHDLMQRETIDPTWASATEAQLMQFVFDRAQLLRRYGTPTVRCHSMRCELTWVSYSSSETEAAVQSDFGALRDTLNEFMPGAFECGLSKCLLRIDVEDGLTTVFWGITSPEE
jgi:hypothetical protein